MVRRIGVIGGGQLAWMMAGAAQKLGLELIVQTPDQSDPAVAIATHTILAAIEDAAATAELANRCDVITFENEFVNLAALQQLESQGVCFRPQLATLAPLLDKYDQRCFLRDAGLPTPCFAALEEFGGQFPIAFPIVLKTRRHGYDGYGTFMISDADQLEATLTKLGDRPLLVEEFVPFERELAAIAARSVTGEIAVYPIVETQQENQVCRRVFAPAELSPSTVAQIEAIAHTLLDRLQVIGLFGIELFLRSDGTVLVNEVAPRTHNSGHFTLDACETSQFEQLLRSVAGLPLGDPAMQCAQAVMVNLLGFEHSYSDYLAQRQQLAAIPQAHVHWYGKTEARPGRKLGHVTVLLEQKNSELARAIAQQIASLWSGNN